MYIKYLEEQYHEGIDINDLVFANNYDEGYRFIICGIAGRPMPKQLTYVGNFGDIADLKRPEENKSKVEKLNCNSMMYVKTIEYICVSGYLMKILGVEGKEIAGKDRYMTEDEYRQYTLETERRRIIREEREYKERKKREYYVCPWKDGDTFYLPIKKEWEHAEGLYWHCIC